MLLFLFVLILSYSYSNNDANSAEYLARSLLACVAKQCSTNHATDNDLLISDNEVPQELLPEPIPSNQSSSELNLTESIEQNTVNFFTNFINT